MKAKRIGVLGCSVIAKPGHMAALRHVAGISLHAVGDVSWQRALSPETKFRMTHASPAEQAFRKLDIDAVVICTPAQFHLANVPQATRHGKHVLCEKSLAMDEADFALMIRAMDEAELVLFTRSLL
ncbi:MAG: Gfo/Idh/MocA family oxidoreductase [Planctomycetaceae bacterium]